MKTAGETDDAKKQAEVQRHALGAEAIDTVTAVTHDSLAHARSLVDADGIVTSLEVLQGFRDVRPAFRYSAANPPGGLGDAVLS